MRPKTPKLLEDKTLRADTPFLLGDLAVLAV